MQLSKEIDQVLSKLCKELGFKKVKYGWKCTNIEGDIYGLINFGTVSQIKDRRGRSVFVSIHSVAIEKIRYFLKGIPYVNYNQTIGINLGYLMPQKKYETWWFFEDSDVELICRRMISSYNSFGQPFLNEFRTNSDICKYLTFNKMPDKWKSLETISIIDYLEGEKKKGLLFLSSETTSDGDLYIEKFEECRTFYNNFKNLPDNPFDFFNEAADTCADNGAVNDGESTIVKNR